MDYERVGISNFKGSSMGMVLVLFILLVIVTSAFCSWNNGNRINNGSDDDDNGSSSISSTRSFTITNNSETIRFQLNGLTQGATPPTPSSILNRSGGQNFFSVPTVLNRDVRVTASYLGYNLNGNPAGFIEFTLRVQTAFSGNIYVVRTSIINVTASAPVTWGTTATSLTIIDA
ncbi:YjcZ family sporulation protein [Paenibacillus herberti]|uniref:Uncharacterized protein n=1 Tax=Paenibacillus herberti TaxID=1619309 RepID=A0A229NXF4_9BACL|nr:YjcZ family sporulation protein [Paenibacillus herberti]OXM14612.1 hypothetical protein CGZ75_16965 [Paenibacillus herberti]